MRAIVQASSMIKQNMRPRFMVGTHVAVHTEIGVRIGRLVRNALYSKRIENHRVQAEGYTCEIVFDNGARHFTDQDRILYSVPDAVARPK